MGGGSGDPSATSILPDGGWGGIGGGKGEPSAYCVGPMEMGLPAERLTEHTTGSTIKTARTETATAIAVFFKGVALLKDHREEAQRRRGSVVENVPNAEHRAG
jgi:hypothetical protein